MTEEMKQAIIIRTDLGMGRGKIAAQASHASVLGAEHVRRSRNEWFEEWWPHQKKIVLRASDAKELESAKRRAIESNLPWSHVHDAGLTQVDPGTLTCISIGPAPAEALDRITGEMKLL